MGTQFDPDMCITILIQSINLADPTYMIRAIPSNASDNVYCTLLAHSAIHGAMAGYTGFTVGPVNGRHAFIPFNVSDAVSFNEHYCISAILFVQINTLFDQIHVIGY